MIQLHPSASTHNLLTLVTDSVGNSHSHSHADDEVSVSSEHSTFAVVNAKTIDATTTTDTTTDITHPSRRRRRRTVLIDTSRNEYYDNTRVSDETPPPSDDTAATWFSYEELKQCKGRTAALAKEVYRADLQQAQAQPDTQTYTSVVLDAYYACCRASFSQQDDEQESTETTTTTTTTTTTVLSPTEHQALLQWMQIGLLRHGLERTAVRTIAMDKRNRRARIVQAVLDGQQQQQHDDDDDESDDILRELSASISRPSRLFAREMAAVVAESLYSQQ